jgi:hypothetical protein
MKKTFIAALCSFLFLCFSFSGISQVSRHLDIPARLQWDNDGGYCGETSIQMIGLYYGNYISQNSCRIIAGGEVLIGNDNGEVALDKMAFNYEAWDYTKPAPQYQNYLVWLKKQLCQSHPVIIGVFVDGETNTEYDHILPAIGFSSVDTNSFNNTDRLDFNSCYDPSFFSRTFQSIWDTRSMMGNGATNTYCIPRDVDYAVAVTGIKDVDHVTKPVQLTINRWDEPNVSIGESPATITATIKIDSLVIGENYALLRYNTFSSVPAAHFSEAGTYSTQYFTATAKQQIFTASFLSNSCAFYRCVPTQLLDVNQVKPATANQPLIYPNPCTQFLMINDAASTQLEIYNMQGACIQSFENIPANHFMDVSKWPAGTYFMKFINANGVSTQKLIKQ